MKNKLNDIKNMLINNKSIIENYFFMTILGFLNTFFYFLIYPYIIKRLGAEMYGIYVYAFSVSLYFNTFISFGFDLPAVKFVARNIGDKNRINYIVSSIFTAKVYLYIFSCFILGILLFVVPIFLEYKAVFISCFLAIFSNVLFPQWYFQGIEKMRVVTFIQLFAKLLSLVFIVYWVKDSTDLVKYSWIICFTSIIGGVVAFLLLRIKYKINIYIVKLYRIRFWFKEGLPFFYTSFIATLKEHSIPIIIGTFFGMKDVAIYDLANKVVTVPRVFIANINAAIFPKIVKNNDKRKIVSIIKIEYIISLFIVIFLVLFGKYIITYIGGKGMDYSYWVLVALSGTVPPWLVIGAYIYFVFIPNGKSYYVAKNQLLASISFIILSLLCILIYRDIISFAIAITLSGFIEIIYCRYITKREKLLYIK